MEGGKDKSSKTEKDLVLLPLFSQAVIMSQNPQG